MFTGNGEICGEDFTKTELRFVKDNFSAIIVPRPVTVAKEVIRISVPCLEFLAPNLF